jgi:hypothetical protein
MANTKISALTSATTPLAGTEVLPIVQSSTTVKVAVSDLTAGRSISVAGLTNTGLTASKPVFTDASKVLTSTGVVPTANGGTNLTSFTANGVVYASSTSALATGSALRFDGTNLGIGTTPVTKLTVDNTRSDTAGTGWATISDLGVTSGKRGMRVDTSNTYWFDYYNGSSWSAQMGLTSGNALLLGTTNANVGTATGFRVVGVTSDADRAELGSAASTNSGIGWSMYSTGAAAYRFYVGWGGTIYATSTTITGISDQRLKENIRDLDDGLASVMALKPRKFDWKEGKGSNTKNARGFIAQEFEQVFPDMIDEWQDPAPEGEEPYKAVRADLIPTLVKAIQEQQAIITSLTTRIAALETK